MKRFPAAPPPCGDKDSMPVAATMIGGFGIGRDDG
jgi:hypothetical protein